MTLNFVNNFQTGIYQLLATDGDIRTIVDKIYLSVPQDAKYPFLLINILKIDDISKFNQAIYEVELEICAFVKDNTPNILTTLADKIISTIRRAAFVIEGCGVAGIKPGKISIQHSQDLVTTRLSIPYSILLKQNME